MKLTNSWRTLSACLSLVMMVVFTACDQENDEVASDAEEAESIVNDEAIADDLFEDIDLISDEGADYDDNAGGRFENSDSPVMRDCVGREVERRLAEGVFTKIVTLDFQEGCEGPNGRERQGTMVITRVADANESTYTVSTTMENFYLDGRKIEGTRTRVYSTVETGVHQVSITLTDGKVTLEDGRVIERNGEFTKTWNRNTGEISVEGTASGVNRNGVEYEATITEPLIYKPACRTEGVFMAVQGTRSITRTGKADVAIDYGQGDCDKTVDVTVNGENRTIELTITKNH